MAITVDWDMRNKSDEQTYVTLHVSPFLFAFADAEVNLYDVSSNKTLSMLHHLDCMTCKHCLAFFMGNTDI